MSRADWLRRDTLLRRICISLALVSVLAMLGLVGLVFLKYGLDRDSLIMTGTSHAADEIGDSLARLPDGRMAVAPPKALIELFGQHPGDYAFEVLRRDGGVEASANRALLDALWPEVSWDDDIAWHKTEARGRNIYVLARIYQVEGTPLVVRVTLGGDPAGLRWALIRSELNDHILVAMLPLIVLVLLVNILVVRRSLRPLEVVARQVAAIDVARGGLRLSTERMPHEIRVMVRTINQALARIDDALCFQREFTAMVAHELRTPLAILSLRLEAVPGGADATAKAVVAEMAHQVDQLVRVAKLEAGSAEAKEIVDLAAVGRELTERHAPLALDHGRELAFEDRGATATFGRRDAIMGALRNLVDNALRATPVDTTVWVLAGPGPSLHVRDQGAGVPAELRDTLFDPFAFGESYRGGTGLGLAIVARTMALHGGRASFENLPDGCEFHLAFPAA
jgi:signal transduction histidine kinase